MKNLILIFAAVLLVSCERSQIPVTLTKNNQKVLIIDESGLLRKGDSILVESQDGKHWQISGQEYRLEDFEGAYSGHHYRVAVVGLPDSVRTYKPMVRDAESGQCMNCDTVVINNIFIGDSWDTDTVIHPFKHR